MDFTEWIVCVAVVATVLWALSFFVDLPGESSASTPTQYPRIVGESGVWVEEIKDFEMATVETAPLVLTIMPMDEAKKIAEDAR